MQAIRLAAEAIIAADGVAALTMRDLAVAADVAIGTIYQFFDDKAAVLDTVVRHHMSTFDAVRGRDPCLPPRTLAWPALVDLVFDRIIERSRGNPAYLAIRAEHHLSPDMQRADEVNIAALADTLLAAVAAQEGLTTTARLRTVCLVAVQAAEALLQLAFRLDARGDEVTLTEARRIARVYLADTIAEAKA